MIEFEAFFGWFTLCSSWNSELGGGVLSLANTEEVLLTSYEPLAIRNGRRARAPFPERVFSKHLARGARFDNFDNAIVGNECDLTVKGDE